MENVLEFPKGLARKAVILARVSSREQEEGHSIEAQKHRLNLYCQRRGLEVVRVFEITESSTRGDREQFKAMIGFAKGQRQPIAIVADKVDRVQRSFTEYPLLDALIQQGKIELHFNTENYIIHQGSQSQQRMMWSFGVMMAQSYTDSLRDNVVRSFDHMIRNGQYPTVAPIGYLNMRDPQGKSDIAVDSDRAPLVRRIFEEFAAGGYTLAHITAAAGEWGLRNKTKRGNTMGRSHLYKILNNPFYFGFMSIKGKLYPHRYPPLIDKKLFDECQAVLKGWNKKPFKWGDKEFVFRGLLTCANAGRTVSALHKKKTYQNGETGEWIYLRAWDASGKPIYVREDKILKQAAEALRTLHIAPEVMEGVTAHLRTTERSEREFLRRQTDELRREHSRIQSRIDGLMDLLMDGAITREDFDRRRAQMRERQIEIEQLLAAQREADDGFKDAMLFLMDLCRNAADLFAGSTIAEKRQLLGFTLENLRLDGERLCFDYKKPFCWFSNVGKVEKWSDWVDRLRTTPAMRDNIIYMSKIAIAA